MSAALGNAFNKTGNAFTLHDESNFESTLQQSTASIRANPFNDSVSAFSEINTSKASNMSTPKKEAEIREVLTQNNSNFGAMFGGFNTVSSKYESINGTDKLKTQEFANVKNPFTKEKNTWNELNALDFSRIQSELSSIENQSSIFSNLNQDQSAAKNEAKKEIPADFFNDVANAAFSEFNAARQKNNEFFNKITGFDCVRT